MSGLLNCLHIYFTISNDILGFFNQRVSKPKYLILNPPPPPKNITTKQPYSRKTAYNDIFSDAILRI